MLLFINNYSSFPKYIFAYFLVKNKKIRSFFPPPEKFIYLSYGVSEMTDSLLMLVFKLIYDFYFVPLSNLYYKYKRIPCYILAIIRRNKFENGRGKNVHSF
uniref:Uncharacterized protein n=1 Tax=Cacopsylla melanoneura TaxID=428564 RepID=A0A8D9F4X8_9HEMI